MLVRFQSAVALITCGCLVSLAASPSSIGFVVTNGEAMVDGAMVQRNSTLFQGSLVQAQNVTSDLVLPGGSNLLLQPGSSANVFRNYAVLRNGTVTERGGHGYVVFADGVRISSLSPEGGFTVGLNDRSHLNVSAQGGPAEVRNPSGALVARLDAGKALGFAVQETQQNPTGQSTPPPDTTITTAPEPAASEAGQQVTLHGILRKDHAGKYGHYLLTDLASYVTYELQGQGLDDLVGGSVEVTGSTLGTTPASTATRVLSVFDVHQMTMGEINGSPEPAQPAKSAAAPPQPTGDVRPTPGAGPEVAARPEATAPPEPISEPAPPPLATHTDTAKVLIIVALAAGAGVGVALGLAGGKSSTVSPE